MGRHCRSAILTEPFCRSDAPGSHYELYRGRYLDFERRSASPVVFKKAHVTRCLVNGDTFCDPTRPYVDNSPNVGALHSRLVYSAELRTDRQLYGSDRAARTNHLALCPPCPNHSLTTARTRQSPYELGRRHGRNRSRNRTAARCNCGARKYHSELA